MEKSRTLLVWAIFLSILLHVFGAEIPRWIPDSWLRGLQADWMKRDEPVEIEVVDRRESKERQQFVKSFEDAAKEEQDPEKLKERAQFLSDRVRRYKEQLQAALRGETQNMGGKPQPVPKNANLKPTFNPRAAAPHVKLDDATNGDLAFDARRQRETNFRTQPRPSMIGETLPREINKGMFNVLNTDYLTFYSFYERFGSMVRFNWSRELEKISNDAGLRQTMITSTNREWTTEMKVYLRPNGEITKVTIMKPSGIPLLDRAHKQTFVDVGLVPNPPKEMVKEDGLISIDVALTIFYDPTSMNR